MLYLYERDIRPQMTQSDEGKFVVIDIETGDYEIDADEVAAHDRLLSRNTGAQVWVTQLASRYARRFGSRLLASRRHGLLYGHELTVEAVSGGRVVIELLP